MHQAFVVYKSIRLFLVMTLLVALLGSLSACVANTEGARSTADSTTSQVIIAMSTSSEPEAGFDPIINWGAGEHMHEPLIQSTLFTTNTDMSFSNDLATDYECSKDGLAWIFTIRSDVKFTDGKALTAEDVAFTFNEIRTNPASEIDLSMVDAVVAPNVTTVVLTLNKPFNALLYNIAVIGIVPAHAYDEDYGSNPLGSGRYMLERWDVGQQVILVANPDYYGEAPTMQRVVVVFMDEDAALAAVKAGQVDLSATTAVFSNQIIEGFEILSCASVDSRGISLPSISEGGIRTEDDDEYATGNKVTSDLALRQAINYALDRVVMVDNVLNGYGTAAYSVSDGMPWASEKLMVKQDTQKALQILEAGGWTLDSSGYRSKDGVVAAFTLLYPAYDSVRQGLAAEFANQMKSIGIKVTIEGTSWADIYPSMYTTPVLWGWGSNSPIELFSLYYSSGNSNFTGYESSAIDDAYDEALAQPAIANSYQYWQQGTEEVGPNAEATWVWLVNVNHLYFKRTNLDVGEQKLQPHGHGWSVANNVDQWIWG